MQESPKNSVTAAKPTASKSSNLKLMKQNVSLERGELARNESPVPRRKVVVATSKTQAKQTQSKNNIVIGGAQLVNQDIKQDAS